MNRSIAKIAIVAIAAASLAACTATRTQKTAGEQIDDSVHHRQGEGRTGRKIPQPRRTDRRRDVPRHGAAERLREFGRCEGRCHTRSQLGRRRAEASTTTWRSRTRTRSAGDVIDDSVVTAKVKAALIADPNVKAHEVNVETREGVVQLSGFVDNDQAKSDRHGCGQAGRGRQGSQERPADQAARVFRSACQKARKGAGHACPAPAPGTQKLARTNISGPVYVEARTFRTRSSSSHDIDLHPQLRETKSNRHVGLPAKLHVRMIVGNLPLESST